MYNSVNSNICNIVCKVRTRKQLALELVRAGVEPNPGPGSRKGVTLVSANKRRSVRGPNHPNPRRRNKAKSDQYLVKKTQFGGGPKRLIKEVEDSEFHEYRYEQMATLTNVADTEASFQYKNCTFLFNTAGSDPKPGFAVDSAKYFRSRVLGFGGKIEIVNNEAFPVTVIYGYLQNNVASGSLTLPYAGNKNMRTKLLGAAGSMNRHVFNMWNTPANIVGTEAALYEESYTSLNASDTLAAAGTCYMYIGIISNTVLTALGCTVRGDFKIHTLMYNPAPLLALVDQSSETVEDPRIKELQDQVSALTVKLSALLDLKF